MPFVRLAGVSELEPDQGFRVELGDEEAVALIRTADGGVHAVEDVCSHEEYPLSEGWVEDHTIECALHGSRFDLLTGEPDSPPALRPVREGSEACGPVVTCLCPAGDNLAVVLALDLCTAGDVLLVQADPTVEVALFGGLLATFAAERRLAGVVVDGWIRDVAEIRAIALPVWSRGVRLAGPSRSSVAPKPRITSAVMPLTGPR